MRERYKFRDLWMLLKGLMPYRHECADFNKGIMVKTWKIHIAWQYFLKDMKIWYKDIRVRR